jgi:hypothetical protein
MACCLYVLYLRKIPVSVFLRVPYIRTELGARSIRRSRHFMDETENDLPKADPSSMEKDWPLGATFAQSRHPAPTVLPTALTGLVACN